MEEKENLPPLPANHVARENALGEVLWESEEGPYTADQMREYGALCARMAREEAAKVCEGLIPEMEDGVREDSYAATALRCAAAIRKG